MRTPAFLNHRGTEAQRHRTQRHRRGKTADSADRRRLTQIDSSHHRKCRNHEDTKTRRIHEDIAHRMYWTRIARMTRIFRIGLHPVMQRQSAGAPRLEVVASRYWKVDRQTRTLVDRPSDTSGRAYSTPTRPRLIQDPRYPHPSHQGKKDFNARVGRV